MPWDITIHLEDGPGGLAAVTATAGEVGINLEGMCATVCAGIGVVHLLVDDGPGLEQILTAAGFNVVACREVLVTVVEDRPGALGEVCRRVAGAGVNLDLAYLARADRLVIAGDDMAKARRVL
jgi:hypothetical protein